MPKRILHWENIWILFWSFPSIVITLSWLLSIYVWVLKGFPQPYVNYGIDAGMDQLICAKILLLIGFAFKIKKFLK